jgi:hypothetical protein
MATALFIPILNKRLLTVVSPVADNSLTNKAHSGCKFVSETKDNTFCAGDSRHSIYTQNHRG